jgi:hypothetical protein
MAYQRSKRTQFNPADIRVNRGQSLSQFGSTYAQAAFKQVDEAQNLLDKKLDDYIEAQKLEGTELAEGTEIIKETQEFVNEDGAVMTYDVPVSYDRPEKLIKTKWAANTYDEQIQKTYTDSLIGTLNEIVLNEKQQQKMTVDYDQTVPESKLLFETNVSEGINALRNTVPERYRNYFDEKTKQFVSAATTELTNRQVVKREKYFSALGKINRDEADSYHVANLLNTNYKEKDNALEEQYDEQAQALANGDANAKIWLEETYPAMKEMNEMAKFIAPYFQVNYNDPKSILKAVHNLNTIEQIFNNESNPNLMIKGENGEDLTIKSLRDAGYNVDNIVNRKKFQSTFSRAKELLKERLTVRDDEISALDYKYRADNLPLKMRPSETIKVREDFAKYLSIAGSDLNDEIVPEFIAYLALENKRKGLGPYNTKFNSDNMDQPEHVGMLQQYYTYVAGKYQVLPTLLNKQLTDNAGSLVSLVNTGQLSGDTRQLIEKVINLPAFKMVRGIIMNNKSGDARFISILENVPGIDDDQIRLLNQMFRMYAQDPNPNDASNRIINVLIQQKENEKNFIKRSGFEDAAEINEAIEANILSSLSSDLFDPDNIIDQRYMQVAKQAIYEELMLTNESFQKGRLENIIPETVATVTKRLNKSGMYGESTFTTGRGYTADDDENDENNRAFGMWSLDNEFLKKENVPPGFTKTREDEYTEEHKQYVRETQRIEADGGKRGRTKAWKTINNQIIAAIDDPKAKVQNKQFDFSTKLELGRNVFLIPTSMNQFDSSKVTYQAVFYSSPGAQPYYMKNYKGNAIIYERKEILRIAQDNETIETKIEDLVIEKGLSRKIKDAFSLTGELLSPSYKEAKDKERAKLAEEKKVFEKLKKKDEENL